MIKKIRLIKDICWFFAFLGLVGGAFRVCFGLGETTNLSDAVPWGLWKILNMVAGVALSTSGFTVGFLVVVLKLERFRPLLKPAILIAFLGYGASCFALLFDIGLPHRFWHPIFMWNEHSFLFEVFWCVLLYFTVTFIELLPAIMERFRSEKLVRLLHRFSFGLVVVGISLSSLHHSSLGSLFLVTPQRLHPLWYSSLLPVFFILSAMGAGIMMVVFVRILYARWYDPEPVFGRSGNKACGGACAERMNGNSIGLEKQGGRDLPMLKGLAAVGASVLAVYMVLKIMDLFRRGIWSDLSSGSWESYLFVFEMLISTIVPIALLIIPRTRKTIFGLGMASLSATAGLALNRMNVGIFGYFRDAGTTYFPSLTEWAVSIGVIAAAGLVFFFVVENFSIFDEGWKARRITRGAFKASYGTLLRMWNTAMVDGMHRVTLIAVFTIPMAWVFMYPPYTEARESAASEVQPSVGRDALREHLRIDGNRSGVYADFPHADHQKRLGGEASCDTCHHVSLPGDRSTPCFRCHRHMVKKTLIFDHRLHVNRVAVKEGLKGWVPSNHSCDLCHDETQPKHAGSAKPCIACHEEDMWLGRKPAGSAELKWARSYQDAMHLACIPCHQETDCHTGTYPLGDCSTCHPSLVPSAVMCITASNPGKDTK